MRKRPPVTDPEQLREEIEQHPPEPSQPAEPEQPASPSTPTPSSHESEPGEMGLARETRRALELQGRNISQLFDGHERLTASLQEVIAQFRETMAEMRATYQLGQQMISRQDEQTENLGMMTNALAKAEARLYQTAQTVERHLEKHQQ